MYHIPSFISMVHIESCDDSCMCRISHLHTHTRTHTRTPSVKHLHPRAHPNFTRMIRTLISVPETEGLQWIGESCGVLDMEKIAGTTVMTVSEVTDLTRKCMVYVCSAFSLYLPAGIR